eukprot:gene43594-11740_t
MEPLQPVPIVPCNGVAAGVPPADVGAPAPLGNSGSTEGAGVAAGATGTTGTNGAT